MMRLWPIGHIALGVPQAEIMLNSLSRESKIAVSKTVFASAVHSPNKLVMANQFLNVFRIFGQLIILL
jgi:hypothetical protein